MCTATFILTVIAPHGTQGIRVLLLPEDYPPPRASEPEMLIWFDCFVRGGGYYIYFFTSGSSQTLLKRLEQKRNIPVR